MNEPENFLERWSKRKLAKKEQSTPDQTMSQQQPGLDDHPAEPAANEGDAAAGESQAIDLSSLPSIDAIDANTQVAAFLRAGVPPELTRAALRRAWTSDPAIRDFVGLVENGWDFNNPEAVGGFGTISADEVARLASYLIEQAPEAFSEPAAKTNRGEDEPESSQPAGGVGDGKEPDGKTPLPMPADPQGSIKNVAMQKKAGD